MGDSVKMKLYRTFSVLALCLMVLMGSAASNVASGVGNDYTTKGLLETIMSPSKE